MQYLILMSLKFLYAIYNYYASWMLCGLEGWWDRHMCTQSMMSISCWTAVDKSNHLLLQFLPHLSRTSSYTFFTLVQQGLNTVGRVGLPPHTVSNREQREQKSLFTINLQIFKEVFLKKLYCFRNRELSSKLSHTVIQCFDICVNFMHTDY